MKQFAVVFLLLAMMSVPIASEASLVKLTPTAKADPPAASAPAVPDAPGATATAAMERALAEHFAKFQSKDPAEQKLAARYRAVLVDAKLLPAERRRELYEVLEEASRRPLAATRQPDLVRVDPQEAPRFLDDGDAPRLRATVERSIAQLARSTVELAPFGGRMVRRADLLATLLEFRGLLVASPSAAALDARVRELFDVYRSPGKCGTGGVLYTAYNDPVFEGALARDAKHRYPLYRPPLLAKVPDTRFDRRQIDHGALSGKGLELVWLTHPAEAYLLEMEGSGLVRLPGGKVLRIRYASTNGRPFVGLGAAVEKDGLLTPAELARAQGRRLYVERPDLALAALEKNPRVIFFEAAPLAGAAEQALDLSPGRSVAVDTAYFPRGGLGFMCLDRPEFNAKATRPATYQPLNRWILNQDTGNAIRGPGRIDIYWGCDQTAQLAAGQLRQPGSLFYLLLKGTPLIDARTATAQKLAKLPGNSRSLDTGRAPSALRPRASGSARRPKGS